MPYGILVIEDEEILSKNIGRYLQRYDYEVRLAHAPQEGLEAFESFRPDLVLLDYQLPGGDGLSVLRQIRKLDPTVKVIMITAHGTIEIAVDAMKAGAFDYLNKPLVLSELRLLIEKALGQERLEGTLHYHQARQASRGALDALIGESSAIQALRQKIQRIVAAEAQLADGAPPAVLIAGETGTGKQLVARALHFEGPRRAQPFIELNCAALPEQLIESELFGYERGAFTGARSRKLGLAEAAHGGTLFLDEVAELAPQVQAKLLKLLEDQTVRRLGSLRDHKIDARIIAATNRPLEKFIDSGAFRADLFYRLRTVTLNVPPLRARGDDIILLARHFVALHAKRYGRSGLRLSAEGEAQLKAQDWPGNVRELHNVLEQAVLLASGTVIDVASLALPPDPVRKTGSAAGSETSVVLPETGLHLENLERELVRQALERTQGNITRAARLLGLSRDTLRYRLEKHGLHKSRGQGAP